MAWTGNSGGYRCVDCDEWRAEVPAVHECGPVDRITGSAEAAMVALEDWLPD